MEGFYLLFMAQKELSDSALQKCLIQFVAFFQFWLQMRVVLRAEGFFDGGQEIEALAEFLCDKFLDLIDFVKLLA